ncbi:MAG TPA: DUF2267 domain-containing protein [Pseudonocardiaceae bacterium]|nr:DUF2267 domain-containing protein [Pseudonocardiaceae bacterium]
MDYEQFVKIVQDRADLDREGAERAVRSVLETLAARISRGEAGDLTGRLPEEVRPWLVHEGNRERFDVKEFTRRIADREGVDLGIATEHARAVFYALGRVVTREEIEDVAAELPSDFGPLIDEALREEVEIMPADEFVRRVAQRAGLDDEHTRKAVDAVLETLGERISGGEVDDLVGQLPEELHAPLRRGTDRTHGAAQKMSLDDFVRRVAEREGVPPDQAREHARAVFATLREAVTDKEFSDVTSQLPDEYDVLLRS